MAILKEVRYTEGEQCLICLARGVKNRPVVIRYPPGKSLLTGGAAYVHISCSEIAGDWTRTDGTPVRAKRVAPDFLPDWSGNNLNYSTVTCGSCGSVIPPKRAIIRKPKGDGWSAWVHPACVEGKGWLRQTKSGAWAREAPAEQEEVAVTAKIDTTIKPGKGTMTAGSLRHKPKDPTASYWLRPGHLHGLSLTRIREYVESGATDGIAIDCYYVKNYRQNFTPIRFGHDEIIKVAAARGLPTERHVCENVVIREEFVTKEVIVERGASTWKELSFGEAASLTASLQHGQHILNDDLRRAMVAEDVEEITKCQGRLVDHLSLMDKLGVPRANWQDNYQAMLRAGRVEMDLPLEQSIWN